MSKWDLYDRLIAGIAEDILVEDYAVSCAWTMMKGRRCVRDCPDRAAARRKK